jgi:rubrerythrin
MTIRFSADEILSVAEQIEANGVRFYETAASRISDVKAQKLLRELARWETTHQRTFASMREQLPSGQKDSDVFDPEQEIALYLKTFADEHVFNPQQDPLGRLGEHPAYRDILCKAIDIEKDSIVFYVAMKPFVPESMGRVQVEKILQEEAGHMAILTQELAQLK